MPKAKTPKPKLAIAETPKGSPIDQEIIYADARSLAGLRAVDRTEGKLRAAAAAAKSKWAGEVKLCSNRIGEILGENEDGPEELELEDAHRLFVELVGLHKKRKDLQVQATREADAWSVKVGSMSAAQAEIKAASRTNKRQTGLFDSSAGVRGMDWASEETLAAILAALVELDKDKLLDPMQVSLLEDLQVVGLDAVELGLKAAEAIEGVGVEGDAPDDETEHYEVFPVR